MTFRSLPATFFSAGSSLPRFLRSAMSSRADSSDSSSTSFDILIKTEATAQDTAVATANAERFATSAEVFGVIAIIAKIEPGEDGAIRPPPRRPSVKTPDMPPAIAAMMRIGFIRMYGK